MFSLIDGKILTFKVEVISDRAAINTSHFENCVKCCVSSYLSHWLDAGWVVGHC